MKKHYGSWFIFGAIIGSIFAALFFLSGSLSATLSRSETFDLFSWMGSQVSKFFPWPILLSLAGVFLWIRSGEQFVDGTIEWFSGVSSIEGWGAKVKRNPDKATQIQKLSTDALAADAKVKMDALAMKFSIPEKFEQLVRQAITPLVQHGKESFRCAIHVPDALYHDSLYQLTDYEPPIFDPTKLRGRRRSIRFGIIGRAVRLEKSIYKPDITNSEQELVENWGMTKREAHEVTQDRASFFVVRLKDSAGNLVGLVFGDAKPPSAFGNLESDISKIEEAVVSKSATLGLTTALTRLVAQSKDEIKNII